jgi:uncharacterized membrane protein YadS
MNILQKALYSLSLAIVLCAGKLPEALVPAIILFTFLMLPERKNEQEPKSEKKPNLWFAGVFFILITATALRAVQEQTNALIVIIAYTTLIVLLTRGVLQKD